MRVLVTGAGGLLGGRLSALLAGEFEVWAGRHRAPPPAGMPWVSVDLLAPSSLDAAIDRARPDAVLHAAALADADRCQTHPEDAEAANVHGSLQLARRCRVRGLRLVALSSDLVLPGQAAFSRESDPPAPVLTYGWTKLRGEQAVLAEAPDAVVLRLSLVLGRGYGPQGTASEAVAWALRAGRTLRLFTDQFRTPVDPASVAAAARTALAGRGLGVYHLGGPERLSRWDLGRRVALVLGLPSERIAPVTQAELPLSAPRPLDVSLDSARAQRDLGWQPRPLDDAIREGRRAPDIIPATSGD